MKNIIKNCGEILIIDGKIKYKYLSFIYFPGSLKHDEIILKF